MEFDSATWCYWLYCNGNFTERRLSVCREWQAGTHTRMHGHTHAHCRQRCTTLSFRNCAYYSDFSARSESFIGAEAPRRNDPEATRSWTSWCARTSSVGSGFGIPAWGSCDLDNKSLMMMMVVPGLAVLFRSFFTRLRGTLIPLKARCIDEAARNRALPPTAPQNLVGIET